MDLRERQRLLGEILKGVSRAFYLTLRVLPAGLKEPVGLAYLLARAADTIADTKALDPAERLRKLLAFRRQVEGPADPEILKELTAGLRKGQTLPAEEVLLEALPRIFALLAEQPDADRAKIRKVVVTLTRGMEVDLATFPKEDSGKLAALKTPAELDRYTYLVAGCVGEFWTEITCAHRPAFKHWNVEQMSQTGVRFGKALQFTNILRDVPKDLRIGRCYLPEEVLLEYALRPQGLFSASQSEKARPALCALIAVGLTHFDEAEKYILAIPRLEVRLRLATLWPALMGLATLAKLAQSPGWLDPEKRVKVTRGWIYRMMFLSFFAVCSNTLCRGWLRSWRKKAALAAGVEGLPMMLQRENSAQLDAKKSAAHSDPSTAHMETAEPIDAAEHMETAEPIDEDADD